MNNAVLYKGVYLMKGSEAYEMHDKKEFAKLDKHLKALDVKNQELMKRYEK